MKLFLTSAYDSHESLDRLTKLASLDRVGKHAVCHSPREADAILFVEDAHFNDYLYRRVRKHTLVSQYREKTFIYTEADKPFHVLPGLYCSMPKGRFRYDQHISFPVIRSMNKYVKHISSWKVEQDWPFSFVGSMSHKLRKSVLKLGHLSPGISDTSNFDFWHATPQEKAAQGLIFAESMARSRFILCPRGIGTTSLRPYEAMQAARAPVIISDQWVPPSQVNWDFAIFVKESEISRIPEILTTFHDEAAERGKAARAAWEKVYAPDVLFDTTATSIGELLKTRSSRNHSNLTQFAQASVEKVVTSVEMKLRSKVQMYRNLTTS